MQLLGVSFPRPRDQWSAPGPRCTSRTSILEA